MEFCIWNSVTYQEVLLVTERVVAKHVSSLWDRNKQCLVLLHLQTRYNFGARRWTDLNKFGCSGVTVCSAGAPHVSTVTQIRMLQFRVRSQQDASYCNLDLMHCVQTKESLDNLDAKSAKQFCWIRTEAWCVRVSTWSLSPAPDLWSPSPHLPSLLYKLETVSQIIKIIAFLQTTSGAHTNWIRFYQLDFKFCLKLIIKSTHKTLEREQNNFFSVCF